LYYSKYVEKSRQKDHCITEAVSIAPNHPEGDETTEDIEEAPETKYHKHQEAGPAHFVLHKGVYVLWILC